MAPKRALLLFTSVYLTTQDQHDTIDLTDNSITQLANLPLSPRLRTLILANNSIHVIHPSIQQAVPNLSTLILTNNAFAELGDLEVRVFYLLIPRY